MVVVSLKVEVDEVRMGSDPESRMSTLAAFGRAF